MTSDIHSQRLALQNGVDVKTVSSMLGHYDAGFTLRTYTHATRQMQQKAAEKMGSFMAQVDVSRKKTQKYRRESKSFLSGALSPYPRISACGSGCGSGS